MKRKSHNKLWIALLTFKHKHRKLSKLISFLAIVIVLFLILISSYSCLKNISQLHQLPSSQEDNELKPTEAPKLVSDGIDMSEWQDPNSIDYDKLANSIDFAILRLGFTSQKSVKILKKDSSFEQHFAELSKRNIPLGVYWYSTATTKEEAILEAERIVSLLKYKKLDLPIFCDIEDDEHQSPLTAEALTSVVNSFCETIEKYGYSAGIYASTHWLEEELIYSKLDKYHIWLAHWDSNPSFKFDFWQYSEEGHLPGYAGPLDLNHSTINFNDQSSQAK